MELVYLWVEDYKNIQKQGFNFSPRFTCKYDDKTEMLTIDEKEHLENFFGENVNVTTIVGENGSGKSNVINYIIKSLQKIIKEPDIKNNYLFILSIDRTIYVLSTINVNCSKEYELIIIPKYQFEKKINNAEIKKIIEQFSLDLYDYHISFKMRDMQSIKNVYPDKRLSCLEIEKNDINLMVYETLENNNRKQSFGDYFLSDEIIIESNSLYYPRISKDIDRKYFQKIAILSDNLNDKSNVDKFLFIIYAYIGSLLFRFTPNDTFPELQNVNTLNEFEEVLSKKINNILKEHTAPKFSIIEISSLNYRERLLYINDILNYAKNIGKDKKHIEEILGNDEINNVYNGIKMKTNKSKFQINKQYHYIFEKLPACFDINFRDSRRNIEYSDLSSGEKAIIRTQYYIESKIKQSEKNNFLFLFDELDTEVHPQWQKKIIHYLLNIFKEREQNIHFIFTSHSPFLLSDLPKENVIFLQNGKQVDVDINPFGANIHTLLSHGFFMKDGLMGEFAKEKINLAITYLNKQKLSKEELEYCENIIPIIGEPIIKNQLQRMLDSKRLSEIDVIKKQIKELQEELEKKENKKDD